MAASIHKESEKLTAIVQQVLHLRVGQGASSEKVDPSAVQSLIDNVLRSRRHVLDNSGLAVERAIEPNLPAILADEAALQQALQNLLDITCQVRSEPYSHFRREGGERSGSNKHLRPRPRHSGG